MYCVNKFNFAVVFLSSHCSLLYSLFFLRKPNSLVMIRYQRTPSLLCDDFSRTANTVISICEGGIKYIRLRCMNLNFHLKLQSVYRSWNVYMGEIGARMHLIPWILFGKTIVFVYWFGSMSACYQRTCNICLLLVIQKTHAAAAVTVVTACFKCGQKINSTKRWWALPHSCAFIANLWCNSAISWEASNWRGARTTLLCVLSHWHRMTHWTKPRILFIY